MLNSNLEKGVKNVQAEAAKMEAWFRTELAKAKQDGVKNLIVFQHIPFFVKDPNEAEVYNNVPLETRQRYLKLLHETAYGIFSPATSTTMPARATAKSKRSSAGPSACRSRTASPACASSMSPRRA